MDLVESLGNGAQRVFRWEDADELGEVALAASDDAVRVYLLCSGECVREAYGTAWHVGCVALATGAAERLSKLLGGSGSLQSDLAAFVRDGAWLPELLDVLDDAGIPYEYRSIDSVGVLVRMEEQAGLVAVN